MRKLFLASAALIVSSGMSFAQTTTTSPTANATSNTAQTAPMMSPGKTPPAATGMAAPSIPGATSSNTVPVANGVPGPVQQTPAGDSPGKTASSSENGMGMKGHHHMHAMMGGMPADGSAVMYLHIAKDALHRHDKMRADDALSRAETRLLTRVVPATDAGASDDNPAIASIESARKALSTGDMMKALSDTDMAIHQAQGA